MTDPLSTWTALTALAPLLLGGVAGALRMFVEPMAEFRKRSRRLEATLRENAAIELTALLNHSRRIESDNALRGDGVEEPDLVSNYTRSVFTLHRMVHKLEIVRTVVRWCFTLLLAFATLGLAGFFIALLAPSSRTYVVVAAVVLLVFQVALIIVNYTSANQLEQYEDSVIPNNK